MLSLLLRSLLANINVYAIAITEVLKSYKQFILIYFQPKFAAYFTYRTRNSVHTLYTYFFESLILPDLSFQHGALEVNQNIRQTGTSRIVKFSYLSY